MMLVPCVIDDWKHRNLVINKMIIVASLVAQGVFTCSVGDLGSIPGLGRSPGGGHGNPLQYSCLENLAEGYCPWGHKATKLSTAQNDNYVSKQ